MHEHHVGDAVRFFAGHGADPVAGTITDVHADGHTCCVDTKCADSGEWTTHEDVPHGEPCEPGGPYFLCPEDPSITTEVP